MSKERPTVTEFLDCNCLKDRDIVEKEFFSRVFLPNGTMKTTWSHRLDDVNQAFLSAMKSLAASGPLRVMDAGVSSGISTAEWHEFLCRQGLDCEVTATDLLIDAHLTSGFALALLRDNAGAILHFDAFGRGFPPRQRWLSGHAILQAWVIGALRVASWCRLSNERRVRLLTTKLSKQIVAMEDDLTAPNAPQFVEAFDVIRAANLLNRAYFHDDVLLRILANLQHRLKPRGLLIVCRTLADGSNHGTLFARLGNRLTPIDRIGRGSEIEELAAVTPPLLCSTSKAAA